MRRITSSRRRGSSSPSTRNVSRKHLTYRCNAGMLVERAPRGRALDRSHARRRRSRAAPGPTVTVTPEARGIAVRGSTSTTRLASEPGLTARPCVIDTTPRRTRSSATTTTSTDPCALASTQRSSACTPAASMSARVHPHHRLVLVAVVAHRVAPPHLAARREEQAGARRFVRGEPFEHDRRRDLPAPVAEERLADPPHLDRHLGAVGTVGEHDVGVDR